MELSELYRWIDDDPTHGLILQITDSEIDMLKLGKEAMQTFIEKLEIPDDAKTALLALTPRTYTGYAEQLAKIV